MSKIFVVMGKSASGKDSLYRELVKEESLQLTKVIPYTTRPIREKEQNGIEYFFVDDARMMELKQAGKIIEHRAYQTIHGVWNYFTADDGQIDLKQGNYLLIGTLDTFASLRKYYGEDKVIPLYIDVKDSIRLRRALDREDKQGDPKYAELCRRFLADEEDFSEANLRACGVWKYYPNNTSKQECLEQIEQDILTLIEG